ncbi:MAG: hypothetical protein AAGA60_23445 [Cyanobacteria bacterium P01_E01_bin.42]
MDGSPTNIIGLEAIETPLALSADRLEESANLYAEVYECDRALQELTNLDNKINKSQSL